MKAKRPLRVLFVGSEMWPYASAGGLSRVMFYLPQALEKLGVDARVFIPKYGKIDMKKFKPKLVVNQMKVPTGSPNPKFLVCNVLSHRQPNGPMTYFLENQEYYELRANEYGYSDDHIRWGLLQRGLWEFLKVYDGWTPDVVHGHDWHAGLVANFLKEKYRNVEKLEGIKTVFTIHNLGFQALYDHRFVSELNFDGGRKEIPGIFDGEFLKLNSMRRGILHSDLITTVSPTYAKEILTPEYGEKLDGLLKEVRGKLVGVLNGLDYDDYDPATDETIEENFRTGDWIARQKNKEALQERFSLEKNCESPIFGISYRLAEQKGLDLIVDCIETVISEFNAQLVVNGDGDARYKTFFLELADRYPKNVGLNLQFDQKLPRQIFAGADFLLHPSKFEPCGIVHMEAMAYGCIPIVREVGGLADTVIDGKNGFTFNRFDGRSLLVTIARAIEAFKHKEIFQNMQKIAMKEDFSWKAAAERYLRFYKGLLEVK